MTPESIGFGVEYRKVVSVIGERLAMLFVEVAGGERRWSVEEIDEHGRLARVRHFPADSLAGASDYLEERWQAIEHAPAAVRVRHAYGRAARSEKSEMADLLAEDFSLVDHRPLGFGRLDRTAMLSFNARDNRGELGELTPLELHAASERAVVVSQAVVAVTDAGDLLESLWTVLFAARDGKVERIELFDEGDVDAALARAAEIDPDGFAWPTLAEAIAPTDEPWNEADRLHRASVRLLQAGDRAGWTDMMADPITYADRRPMLGVKLDNKQDYVDLILFGLDRNPRFAARQETIAVRGDSHVLMTQHISGAADPGGPFSEWLSLTAWHDGKCTLSINFDPDDLEAAMEELNERYLDSIRVVDDPANFVSIVANRASTRREINQIAAILDRSVESVDHQVIGWPTTTGRDATSDRSASLVGLPDGYLSYTSRTLAAGAVLQLSEQRMRVVGDEGGIQESEYLSLVARNPTTGLWSRNEAFDATHLDAALTRYDEIIAADPDALANDAVTAGGLANYCVRIGGLDHLHRVVADDFVAVGVGSDQQTVTLDDLTTGRVDPTIVGYGVERREVVSVIGERLAMLHVETTGGERRFSVEEIDEHGRVARVEHFAVSDLAAAANHLEQRWLDLEHPPESIRAIMPYTVVHRAADLARPIAPSASPRVSPTTSRWSTTAT